MSTFLATGPRIRLVEDALSQLTDSIGDIREANARIEVRVLRGRKMLTSAALLDETSAAFQFPYYFGDNWNALDECMGDLSWLPAEGYLTVVTHANVLAREATEEFATFVQLMARLGEEWSRFEPSTRPWAPEARLFCLLLHAETGEASVLEEALTSAGVVYSR